MGILSRLFSGKPTATPDPSEGRGPEEADNAIRKASAGGLSVPDMLRSVLSAKVYVPLAEAPIMDGQRMTRWKPATVTKQSGAQFLVAFTDENLMRAFSKANPEHSFRFLVNGAWLLGVLPNDHGIAFNLGGDNGFEWTADGISSYKASQRQ